MSISASPSVSNSNSVASGFAGWLTAQAHMPFVSARVVFPNGNPTTQSSIKVIKQGSKFNYENAHYFPTFI